MTKNTGNEGEKGQGSSDPDQRRTARLGRPAQSPDCSLQIPSFPSRAVPAILPGPAVKAVSAGGFSALEAITEPIPKLAPRQVL